MVPAAKPVAAQTLQRFRTLCYPDGAAISEDIVEVRPYVPYSSNESRGGSDVEWLPKLSRFHSWIASLRTDSEDIALFARK